jgi:hypothetical protein
MANWTTKSEASAIDLARLRLTHRRSVAARWAHVHHNESIQPADALSAPTGPTVFQGFDSHRRSA